MIFLGVKLTIVGIILILATLCLVFVWRREHLPEMTSVHDRTRDDVSKCDNDEMDLLQPRPNGCVPVEIEETQELVI